MVKLLPTRREIWVQSLGWEDLLGKKMAIHSCTYIHIYIDIYTHTHTPTHTYIQEDSDLNLGA